MPDQPDDRNGGKVIPFPGRLETTEELETAWEKELSALAEEQAGPSDYTLSLPATQGPGLTGFIKDMSLGSMIEQKRDRAKALFRTDRVMVFRLLVMAAIDLGCSFSVTVEQRRDNS